MYISISLLFEECIALSGFVQYKEELKRGVNCVNHYHASRLLHREFKY